MRGDERENSSVCFMQKVKNVIAKEALDKCHSIAGKSGLNKMTLTEINAEIEAVRNAKNSH